jgi:hypothetical protein
MKILKNQIQNTLLVVQEQVIILYYPALRPESTEPPPSAILSQPRHAQPNRSNGTHKQLDKENGEIPPVVKEVSLNDIRQRRNGDLPDDVIDVESLLAPEQSGETAHWDQFSLLATWIEKSVERLGVTHTEKLIEMNVSEKVYGSELKGTLQSLLSLYDEADAPERVGMKEMAEQLHGLKQVLNGRSNKSTA